MKRSFLGTLLFVLPFLSFSQENIFIAKPYLQIGRAPSASSLELLWQVPEGAADWGVEVKADPSGRWVKMASPQWTPVAPDGLQPRRVYHTVLTGLVPGGVFNYRVSRAGKVVFTAEGHASKGPEQPYRFVVNGDIGAATTDAKLLAKQSFLSHPDLVVVPGDIIYENGRVSEYDDKFWPIYNADETTDGGAPLMRSIPYIGAPGNHDVDNRSLDQYPDGLAYFFFWRQPLNGPAGVEGNAFVPVMQATEAHRKAFLQAAGEAYPSAVNYSFNYGNAHWLVLDSDPYVNFTDSALRNWIAGDLAGARDAVWRFVIFHHPPFSSSREHYEQQQTRLLSPLFEAGKVDVVFSGHVHNYQRTFPMHFTPDKQGVLLIGGKDNKTIRGRVVNGRWRLDKSYDGKTNTRPDGIVYIVTGAGGQELYNPEQNDDADSWQKYTDKFISNVHSLSVVDIDGRNFTLRQISPEGKELDAISITK
ncbi:MAG: metallophosphoesterase [Chitinophagaceae bacterium]|nr:metallophosphoesterase [Chitinophagaceae bacterium]